MRRYSSSPYKKNFDINFWHDFKSKDGDLTVTDQLAELMDQYFTSYPKVSVNSLAKKSGVGATTLRRIQNKSIKGDPAPHTVLGLISAISGEKSLSKLIGLHQGPVNDLLKKTFGQFEENSSFPHRYEKSLNTLLRDKVSYFIYKRAANKSGVSKIDIAEHYGSFGIEKLNILMSSGWISELDGILHAKEKNFSLDLDVAASHLTSLVEFYKPKHVQEGRNLFYSLSESLNELGIEKIKKIKRDSVQKIYEIMNSPYYEGEIPYFSITLSDTLEIKKDEVLQ